MIPPAASNPWLMVFDVVDDGKEARYVCSCSWRVQGTPKGAFLGEALQRLVHFQTQTAATKNRLQGCAGITRYQILMQPQTHKVGYPLFHEIQLMPESL
jgi:hypothetical protein